RTVKRPPPAAVDDNESVVARLQNPSKATLETEDLRLVVELLQVLPRHVGREVVIEAPCQHLGVEPPLSKHDVVPVTAKCHRHVSIRLQRDAEARLLPCAVIDAPP